MRKVFLDTNVLLDFILERKHFVEDASEIFMLHHIGEVEIHVSALSLANTAYVVEKNGHNPFLVIGKIIQWIKVINLERGHFQVNVTSAFNDFEDGLQYYCASDVQDIEVIITRDKRGFRPSSIPVLSPKEFLKRIDEN